MNHSKALIVSPIQLVFKSTIYIFLVEFCTSQLTHLLPKTSETTQMIFESAFASGLLFVFLWFWILRPLRAQAVEKQSEIEIYNAALEQHIIISRTDSSGKITYVNKKFIQVSGYSEAELIGKDHRIINSRHHSKEFFKEMWTNLKAGKTWHGQVKNKAKDGNYYWVDTVVAPLFNSDGDLTEYISIRRDITRDRRDLQEVKLQKKYYETILNTMEQGFIITNRSGQIEHFNSAALTILKVGADEIRKISLTNSHFYFVAENEEKLSDKDLPNIQTIRTGLPHQTVAGIKQQDGTHIWLQIQSLGFQTEKNKLPDSVLVTLSDITLQIEKKKFLAQIQSRLREAQRVGQIGSWSLNFQTGKILWSDQMYELFPVNDKNGEIKYEECYAFLVPEDRASWDLVLKKCMEEGTPQVAIFRVQHDAKIIWVETRCQKVGGSDRELFGTCQDVTKRVQLEKSLETERIKAVHASKLATLGEISARIAHEINNPLAIISGSAQLIAKEAPQSEKLTARLAMLDKSIERVVKIVKGLKRYSQNSANEKKILRPLAPIVEEAVSLCSLKSRQFDVSLELELDESLFINCNEIEIEQVLINLISNAIDAVKNQIHKNIKISAFEKNRTVFLQVANVGAIPQHVIEKLFVPFFTTKFAEDGTGLGLSISKDIIMDHGGSITLIQNIPDTCFEIRLPAPDILKEKNET